MTSPKKTYANEIVFQNNHIIEIWLTFQTMRSSRQRKNYARAHSNYTTQIERQVFSSISNLAMNFPSCVNIDANLTINFLSYVNMVFSMLTFNIIIINTIQTHNTFLLGTTNIVPNNKHGYKPQTYMFIYIYVN